VVRSVRDREKINFLAAETGVMGFMCETRFSKMLKMWREVGCGSMSPSRRLRGGRVGRVDRG
jgi:hypothetical protein